MLVVIINAVKNVFAAWIGATKKLPRFKITKMAVVFMSVEVV
jgi:hypothetical protein